MSEERIPRTKPTHGKIDLKLPVNPDKIMAADRAIHGKSCYGRLWDMQHKKCASCHDNEMCGINFHKDNARIVKEIEDENPKMLDTNDFDGISYEAALRYLTYLPRSLKQFHKKIKKLSKCDDDDTVSLWITSFLRDTRKFKVDEDGMLVSKTLK